MAMTRPQPGTARVRSEYPDGRAPTFVAKWEKWANEAPSDAAAQVQLAYFQVQQIRAIKLLLAWILIILPIVSAVGLVVLIQILDSGSTPRF